MVEGQAHFMPTVTAIVPTFRPGEELRALLEGLRTQEFSRGESLGVLLVDSTGGPTRAEPLAGEFGARFEKIPPSEFNHGTTRRDAAARCDSPFVAYFTQDAKPLRTDVIALLLDAVRSRESVAGAYARQLPKPDATARTKCEVLAWFPPGEGAVYQEPVRDGAWESLPPSERHRRARFDNVAALLPRDLASGDLGFGAAPFGEDLSWGVRALRAGYRLAYEPRAWVEHSHDRSAWYEFRRTLNCHALLSSEPFGLRAVPTLYSALTGCAGALGEAYKQTVDAPPNGRSKVFELARLPGREAARAFGQYVGGWIGARGLARKLYFRGI